MNNEDLYFLRTVVMCCGLPAAGGRPQGEGTGRSIIQEVALLQEVALFVSCFPAAVARHKPPRGLLVAGRKVGSGGGKP